MSTFDLTALVTQHSLPDAAVQAIRGALGAPHAGLGPSEDHERYEDLGLLGSGGMGEVRRVRDRKLGIELAMKWLRSEVLGSTIAVARFIEEAQATAQLQHPAIPQVHDLGQTQEGLVWFTMDLVDGSGLDREIAKVHFGEGGEHSLRSLIRALATVCDAVAFAHERSVVHRDLKPQNVMVGRHGQVTVLDWGLVKVVGDGSPPAVHTARTESGAFQTRVGQVSGTPAYMAPEVARGLAATSDPKRIDIYSLGAMLYEILGGEAPYAGASETALHALAAGPPGSLKHAPLAMAHPGLLAACEWAMARDPNERPEAVSELAQELVSWLDGGREQAAAERLVRRAKRASRNVEAKGDRIEALRPEVKAALDAIESWAPESSRIPAWTARAELERLEREVCAEDLAIDEILHAALRISEHSLSAREALVARHRARHAEAEGAGRDLEALEEESKLVDAVRGLPAGHPIRGSAERYLEGEGSLTLETEPCGARVVARRYVPSGRRLVLGEPVELGHTPLSVPLAMGSYQLQLSLDARPAVLLPVQVARTEAVVWGPEGRPHPLPIPSEPAAGRLISAGWSILGESSSPSGRQSVWVDAFVMDEFPITNESYLAFLRDLDASGQQAALAERTLEMWPSGPRIPEGLELDGPVVGLSHLDALAYAAWRSTRDGLPWRLPTEQEWERAARGADGRLYPWGSDFDPCFTLVASSHDGPPSPRSVTMTPLDCSPFGVRCMAGHVSEWCSNSVLGVPGEGPGVMRVTKGGSWLANDRFSRLPGGLAVSRTGRSRLVGARLVHSVTS